MKENRLVFSWPTWIGVITLALGFWGLSLTILSVMMSQNQLRHQDEQALFQAINDYRSEMRDIHGRVSQVEVLVQRS